MDRPKEKTLKTIGAMIPLYNESECLSELYKRLSAVLSSISENGKRYDYRILFINDGSTDDSIEIIRTMREKDKRVDYLDLARNYGKEIAMAAGFDFVKGDAVIILDADLQDPPELIPEMVKYWEEGYDDVYGKRKSREGESWLKKKTSKWFYYLLQKTTKIKIQKDTGDFRLLSRRAVEALKKYRESNRYTKGFFSLIGFKKKEILFDRDPRAAGTTKWNYLNLMGLAVEGITSFTSIPLRLSTFLGFIIAVAGFLYMIFIILKTIILGDPVGGYPSLVSIILLLGGIQLISLGIIGEYLGRIFDEVKRRPLYFINEYNGKYANPGNGL